MARIRTIKPDFWTDPALIECSLTARLLFIGLWNFADDYGNIEGHLVKIKASIFPMDKIKVDKYLIELEAHDLIIPYNVNGRKYYNIRTFLKHQKIDHPSKPVYPKYDNSLRIQGGLGEPSVSPRSLLKVLKGRESIKGNISEEDFNIFWKLYKKKEDKADALKNIEKLINKGITLEQIINHTKSYNKKIEDEGIEKKYIKLPATFLNKTDFTEPIESGIPPSKEVPHIAQPREELSPEDRVNPEDIKKFKSNLTGITGIKGLEKLKVDIEEERKNLKHEPTEAEIKRKKKLEEQAETIQ